jgi:hypothetical protein
MLSSRRKFMVSMAGAGVANSVASGWRNADNPVTQRPLDVALVLDVEDIFSPPEVGNDDSIKDLATILTSERLQATFLFIGDRAQLLQERGRRDVIDSMEPHEVGLHGRSARHPAGAEYLAGKSWEDGVAESLKHEREGTEIIRAIFGKPCVALSAHSVYDSPHAQRSAAILGIPYLYGYPAAPPLYSVSWYAGGLGLPYQSPRLDDKPFRAYFDGFDDRYPDTDAFNAYLRRLDEHIDLCIKEGQPYLTLFVYHPQKVRLMDFIDSFWCPNGVNYPKERWGMYGHPRQRTPEQVRMALVNFRRLAQWIRIDPRLNILTVSQVFERYGRQPDSITREELLSSAQAISKSDDILMDPRFSPAEIVMGLAHAVIAFADAGRLTPTVPREEVLGPTLGPISIPELRGCTYERLIRLSREVLDHVKATGELAATLGPPLERVGVNHLYRALAEIFLVMYSGSIPTEIKFQRTSVLSSK